MADIYVDSDEEWADYLPDSFPKLCLDDDQIANIEAEAKAIAAWLSARLKTSELPSSSFTVALGFVTIAAEIAYRAAVEAQINPDTALAQLISAICHGVGADEDPHEEGGSGEAPLN